MVVFHRLQAGLKEESTLQAKISHTQTDEVKNLLRRVRLLLHYLTYGVNYWLPSFSIRAVLRLIIGEKKHNVIWNKLPLRMLKSLILLPDGNKLFFSWEYGREVTYMLHEIYHQQVYDWFFTPKRAFTVVDVGANCGIYTLKAAKKVGTKGLVIAIEPENENYDFLSRNIRINRYNNVIPLKLALSSFEGRSELYVQNFGKHSLITKTNRAVDVSVTTLALLLNRIGVSRIDLMKIDVEGSESEVLRGSEDLLTSKKISRLVIAAYHSPVQAEEIEKYLTFFDYKVRFLTFDKTLTGDNKFLYAHYDFVVN